MRAILIETCNTCPHRSHSGSYTKGGPWPVCHGPGMWSWEEINETLEYNDPNAGQKWSPPILPTDPHNRQYTGVIPEWCPLPNIGV